MKDVDTNEQTDYINNLRAKSTTNHFPVLSKDELREQFETYYSVGNAMRRGGGDSEYINEIIEVMWNAWLACAIQNGVLKK